MNIYLLNRTDRRERLLHSMEQFKQQNLNAHVIEAVINKVGWRGCRDSHLKVLNQIFWDEEMALVCEDDVLFVNDIDLAFEAMCELPVDWDCLYLGGSPQEPQERYSDHLFRVKNTLCTHAIIWNPREGGAMNQIFERDNQYHYGKGEQIGKWDVYLREEIQPNFNCFMVSPLVATQAEFKSDIARRSDVSTIVKNYNKYCL